MNLSRAFDRARRDSDATSVSSPPSPTGKRFSVSSTILSDRGSQMSALSYLNSYLADLSAPFSLSPPFPSGRDIVSAFKFLLERLDYPISEKGFEEDLLSFPLILNCPVKINKSALKAPGAPHTWPKILAVLYWLAQFARVSDHLSESQPPSSTSNDLLPYLTQSYSLFLSGDDDAVAELDEEYASTVRVKNYVSAEQVEGMEKEIADLEAKLAASISGPSLREELEKKRGLLIMDKKKFEAVVETSTERLREMEETRNGLMKELEVKNKEHKQLSEEEDELENRIGRQGVSVRDMERMKREMQVMEKDIEEAKNAKSVAEELVWEAEAGISQKLDEIEVAVEQCNLEEEMKNTLVCKEQESIALQEQLQDKCKISEGKKLVTALQDRLDEIEGRLRLVKNDVEKHRATCAAETKKMIDYLTEKENQLSSVENEAQEFLKSAETKLRNRIRVAEEEEQRLEKRKRAETVRLLDMEKRQKQCLEEMRQNQKKNEETLSLKEGLRAEVRKDLERMRYTGMASILRSLGIPVGGGLVPMPNQVKLAYKQALLKFHPNRVQSSDVHQQVKAEETFKFISSLKEKLLPA